MWKQAYRAGRTTSRPEILRKTTLQILPCAVSQLLSAPQVGSDAFAIYDLEINQVSVVGIVREFSPILTRLKYSVDDMSGPPLSVKQWVNKEDLALMTLPSPGTYVKVIGTLHSVDGQRSLVAVHVRCIKDLNEITSHMLAVVEAHMRLFKKAFDVNMNLASVAGGAFGHGGGHQGILPNGLSRIQAEVLQTVRRSSAFEGIGLNDLKTQLNYLQMRDIRNTLAFLLSEGHVFYTIDEHHFKASEN